MPGEQRSPKTVYGRDDTGIQTLPRFLAPTTFEKRIRKRTEAALARTLYNHTDDRVRRFQQLSECSSPRLSWTNRERDTLEQVEDLKACGWRRKD